MKRTFKLSHWLGCLAILALPLGASGAEIDLYLTQFTAIWDFEGSTSTEQLSDKSGNGHNLTFQATGPGFVTPTPGTNGYSPYALGNSAAQFWGNTSPGNGGPATTNGGFDIPAGTYTGGDYTFVAAVRSTSLYRVPGSANHKTILDPNGGARFQFRPDNLNYVLDPGGSGLGSITDDAWSIVALLHDSSTGETLLDNNSSLANAFTIEGTNGNTTAPLNFRIGTQGGTSDVLHGEIAFALFEDSLLSPAQLDELLTFLNSGPPPPPPLTPEPGSIALFMVALASGGLWYRYRHHRA